MNCDKIMNAIGMIDEELIEEAQRNIIKKKRINKKIIISLVAVLIILFAFGITAAAKEFNYNLDWVLYDAFSHIAESLKPVNLSCEDNGIRMEVISAKKEGQKAHIYISMQDLEGDRIDETIDLYDSFFIRLPSGYSGNCTKIGFDEETQKATFLISIDRNNGLNIPLNKVSFSVGCFLSGRIEPEGFADEIDLSKAEIDAEYETETNKHLKLINPFEPDSLSGKIYRILESPLYVYSMKHDDFIADFYKNNYKYEYWEESEKYLVSSETFYTSETGAEFVAMGFIDDKLHIKVYYGNRHYNDNIGFLTVYDKNGNEINSLNIKYINNIGEIEPNHYAPVETWVDYTFDISPEEIESCRLYERYWKYENYVEGDWKIRFRIP